MTPPTRLIIDLTDHPSEAVLTVLRMGPLAERMNEESLGDLATPTVAGREPSPSGLGPSGDHQLSQGDAA